MAKIMSPPDSAFADLAIEDLGANGEGYSAWRARVAAGALTSAALDKLKAGDVFFVELGTSYYKARVELVNEAADGSIELVGNMAVVPK